MATRKLVPDELKQAFWRIALNGNPHWMRYYSKSGPRGTNDGQCSEGCITQSGRDRSHRAGKAFWYTPAKVNEHQLGFGFWSRSNEGESSTYRFAAWDLEPIAICNRRKISVRQPTSSQVKQTAQEAIAVYQAVKQRAAEDDRIAWLAFVESSVYRYHVWALFAEPLQEQEHRQFVDQVDYLVGPLQNLDKDTRQGAATPFGTQFRAPWSFKRGRCSGILHEKRYRTDEELIELGESLRPRSLGVPDRPDLTTSIEQQLQSLIDRFPLEPGCRNAVQGKLVASLVSRHFSSEQILNLGGKWLEHFQTSYRISLAEAKIRLADCLERTLQNPRFTLERLGPDYQQLHQQAELTPVQQVFLQYQVADIQGNRHLIHEGSPVVMPCHPPLEKGEDDLRIPALSSASPVGGKVLSSLQSLRKGEDDIRTAGEIDTPYGQRVLKSQGENDKPAYGDLSTKPLGENDVQLVPSRDEDHSLYIDSHQQVQGEIDRDIPTQVRIDSHSIGNHQDQVQGEIDRPLRPLCSSSRDRHYVEALILHCQQKQREGQLDEVQMTDRQVLDIMATRHGDVLSDPNQSRRLKQKYITTTWKEQVRPAKVFELLREVHKGTPGSCSRHQITGLELALNGRTELGSDGKATESHEEVFSLASLELEALDQAGGPT